MGNVQTTRHPLSPLQVAAFFDHRQTPTKTRRKPVNRAHRRAVTRRQRKVAAAIHAAAHRAKADRQPVRIFGFTDACADCSAGATITMHPDSTAVADILHDAHCPAANGVVAWRPAS
jgi:hypothetical protein